MTPPRQCLRCHVGFWRVGADGRPNVTDPIPFCDQCLPKERSRRDCPICGRDKPEPKAKGRLVSMCQECFASRRARAKAARMRVTHHRLVPEATQRADAAYPADVDFKHGTLRLGESIRAQAAAQAAEPAGG